MKKHPKSFFFHLCKLDHLKLNNFKCLLVIKTTKLSLEIDVMTTYLNMVLAIFGDHLRLTVYIPEHCFGNIRWPSQVDCLHTWTLFWQYSVTILAGLSTYLNIVLNYSVTISDGLSTYLNIVLAIFCDHLRWTVYIPVDCFGNIRWPSQNQP